tara:strand:- start:60 stop:560 length:501 start_codon:yes stop_codon:yes gene_type:complete
MNPLLPDVGPNYEIVAIINKENMNDENDYQDDIILSIPENFYPKLSKEDIGTLEPIFCVDNMINTKCFSSHKRPIRIIKKYREEFKLEKGYKLGDIIKALKGKTMYVVRRDVDENGIKIDDTYVIVEGIVEDIEPYRIDEYDHTNLLLDFGHKKEPISINRVFFKK